MVRKIKKVGRKNTAIVLFGLAAVFACANGCSPSAGKNAGTGDPSSAPLTVTVTTGMIADAVRNVGGNHVRVVALMGPGVDPHLYKATQGDLAKLREANIIFYNGLHLEGRMGEVFRTMAERLPTIAVAESIPKELLRQPPEFEGNYDPHVWFDVNLWIYVVQKIRDVLSEQDPAHRADYAANAAAYLEQLKQLDSYIREQIAKIPEPQRLLVTAHDAFGYFGRAYGIEVMGIQGISTASDYGLQDLNQLAEILANRKVKAIFVETSVSPRSVEALVEGTRAKGHDIKIGGKLYSDALGEEGTPEGTYIGMVRHNVDTIVKALS
jgi:manganese/zinc/iron transport system substrate-binding protein